MEKGKKKRECDKQCMDRDPCKVAFSSCHCEHVGTGIPLRMARNVLSKAPRWRSLYHGWVVSMRRHDHILDMYVNCYQVSGYKYRYTDPFVLNLLSLSLSLSLSSLVSSSHMYLS